MRRLTDWDIEQMIKNEINQPGADVARTVRAELHLSTRIPKQNDVPQHCVLDLHCFTEEQAWNAIMNLAQSGIKTANIITGASGILKIKFQQWANDSILSPYIISFAPINNGSFFVRFKHKNKKK
ncbi:MAG: Smr/MutS family protein [Alphaproteobacteria bacterium]|nr:Smr/MutS family protein [Alphaproteobacteria bacterium]